jgi:3-mercaptopyruvate sulfurtransferase SseA
MIVSISHADFVARVLTTNVAVVEAMAADFFASAHIPGAVNIAAQTVDDDVRMLLPDCQRSVVVYGSADSDEAERVASRLGSLGYADVRVYLQGKEGWAEAGLPLIHGG